ncbi:MAG TPA: hypothetical protein VIG64_10825, partial [Actinomycetota bacterium]
MRRILQVQIYGRGSMRARSTSAATLALVLVVTLCPSALAQRVPDCFGKRPTIVGTPGDDVIKGTRKADVIYSDGGDDVIEAGRGDDRVCPGSGEDTVLGQLGDDRLDAGSSSRPTVLAGGWG